MPKPLELVGKKFGRLTVVSKYGRVSNSVGWLCKCDCGKEKVIRGGHLSSGATTSCGCYSVDVIRERHRPNRQQTLFNSIRQGYLNGAKKRKLVWELSSQECVSLFLSACYYCGSSPQYHPRKKYKEIAYNGIDRVDNSIGYLTHNVVPCCTRCNLAKNNSSKEEFLAMCKAVAERH